jgi:hypothetical protein
MATFKKFEEIEAWKKARELTKRVYELSRIGHLQRILVYATKYVVPLFPSCRI